MEEAEQASGHEGSPSPAPQEPAASTAQEGVIFVLENASLEVAKVGKVWDCWFGHRCLCARLCSAALRAQGYQLLNCDDHAGFLRRHSKDPALYRPDICHQVPASVPRCTFAALHTELLTRCRPCSRSWTAPWPRLAG